MVLKKVYLILGETMDNGLNKRLKQLEFLKSKSRPMRLAAQGWDKDWKILIAIMMSAQSRDEVTIIIAENLFKKFHSLEKLSLAKQKEVTNAISSLNYYKTKSKHILKCAKLLINEHGGKVPHDFEKLILFPGVGRKTANVFLAELGMNAIGVDTHLSYIAQYLGWSNCKNPDKIEMDLKKLFPKEYWKIINRIVVRFGKSYTNKLDKNVILDMAKKIK